MVTAVLFFSFLLQSMLAFVPDSRASARQSLLHQYFHGVCASDATSEGLGLLQLSNSSGSETPCPTASSSGKHEAPGCNSDIATSGNPVSVTAHSEGQLPAGGESERMSLPLCDEPMLDRSENVPPPLSVSDAGNDENNPNSSNIGSAAASSTISIKTMNPLVANPAPVSTNRRNSSPLGSNSIVPSSSS